MAKCKRVKPHEVLTGAERNPGDDRKFIVDLFIEQAHEAVEAWDGVSTSDLILDILARTGDDVVPTLDEAMHKHLNHPGE